MSDGTLAPAKTGALARAAALLARPWRWYSARYHALENVSYAQVSELRFANLRAAVNIDRVTGRSVSPTGVRVTETQALDPYRVAVKMRGPRRRIRAVKVFQGDSGVLTLAGGASRFGAFDKLRVDIVLGRSVRYDADRVVRHQDGGVSSVADTPV